jgi:CheY-like chemotaxis protein
MKRRWILLAEDDARDAALTKRALGIFSENYDIVVAMDGAEVLDQLHRSGILKNLPKAILRWFCWI